MFFIVISRARNGHSMFFHVREYYVEVCSDCYCFVVLILFLFFLLFWRNLVKCGTCVRKNRPTSFKANNKYISSLRSICVYEGWSSSCPWKRKNENNIRKENVFGIKPIIFERIHSLGPFRNTSSKAFKNVPNNLCSWRKLEMNHKRIEAKVSNE
jgi:hypothetical protein